MVESKLVTNLKKPDSGVFLESISINSDNVRTQAGFASNRMLVREPIKRVYPLRSLSSWPSQKEKTLDALAVVLSELFVESGGEWNPGDTFEFESFLRNVFQKAINEKVAEAIVSEEKPKNLLSKMRALF